MSTPTCGHAGEKRLKAYLLLHDLYLNSLFLDGCCILEDRSKITRWCLYSELNNSMKYFFSSRILEHFILHGSDPKALDCVLDQLNDHNRANPHDLDKASSGV